MPKKSDQQALEWMRKVCLALPDTSEGVHYGEIVFKVGKELFASCGDKRGPRMIVFKINAKETAKLVETDERFEPYPYEKTALMIKSSVVDDWTQMKAFVEESYRLVSKPPKVKKAKAVRRKKVAKKGPRKRA